MSGVAAFGTKWSFSTDGDTTFTDVAEVTNIDVLNIKADTMDVSSHDSPNEYREKLGGMKDGGSLSMAINYDPALHGTIFSNIGGAPIKHKITLTDAGAAVVAFDGIITTMQAKAPFDGKLEATVTVEVSGEPIITP
jgi:predicted secreted protein